MKNLWWLTNGLLTISTIIACPGNRTSTVTEETKGKDSISVMIDSMTPDTSRVPGKVDTMYEAGGAIDTLSKDDKYKPGDRPKKEAPKHGVPDQDKLDTIKNAKKKKKE